MTEKQKDNRDKDNKDLADKKNIVEIQPSSNETEDSEVELHTHDPSPEEQITALKAEVEKLKNNRNKAQKRYQKEQALKPYQAELISLQNYLEDTHKRMIILFEGRDASGKGGTIRRVSRYMNEKRYRTVALGKPTSEQRTQWYFQRYVTQFPHGGEMVLFDRQMVRCRT